MFNVERSSVRSAHDLAASFISSHKEYIFINNSLIIEQDSFNLDLYRRCTKLNLPLSNDCIISAMQAASMTFNLDLYRRFDERQYLSMVDHGTHNGSTRKASDYMERNIYIRRENGEYATLFLFGMKDLFFFFLRSVWILGIEFHLKSSNGVGYLSWNLIFLNLISNS